VISKSTDLLIVAFSVKVYRALLVAYPSKFQREYGSEMVQVFRDSCLRATRQGGMNGMIKLWAITLLDLIQSIISEHLHKETSMTKTKFIRFSGWAFMLGAAFLLPWLIYFMLILTPYNPLLHGLYLEDIVVFGFLYGSILLTIGMLGLHACYGGYGGNLGKSLLLAGTLGSGMLVIAALSLIIDSQAVFYLLLGTLTSGSALLFISLLLFGLLPLTRKPLPREKDLLLTAGFALPLFLKGYGLFASVRFLVENPIFIFLSVIGFIVMTIALMRLGYILKSDASKETAVLA